MRACCLRARAGIPTLGLCLGAQMLAAACGGIAFPGPLPEVGVVPVSLTAAGLSDALLAPLAPCFHVPGRDESRAADGAAVPTLTKKCFRSHHGDTFSLPASAVLLAASSSYQQVECPCALGAALLGLRR